jgi:hypothetical protein
MSRLVPELRDGRTTGWRFHDVEPGLARIGVVKDDVLLSIDGQPAEESVKRCLDGATLRIRRGGQQLVLKYPPL